jgi:hypothetical protein
METNGENSTVCGVTVLLRYLKMREYMHHRPSGDTELIQFTCVQAYNGPDVNKLKYHK